MVLQSMQVQERLLGICLRAILGVLLVSPACAQEKIYYSAFDSGGPTIRRSNLDGSGVELVYAAGGARVIALDLVNGKLYWASETEIMRSTLSGENVGVIVAGVRAWGIALDPSHNRMFWTQDIGGAGVFTADLDGRGVQLLVAPINTAPWGIAIDSGRGKLYWAEPLVSPRIIYRCDLDGSNIEPIVEIAEPHDPIALAIDETGQWLYWAAGDHSFFLGGGTVSRSRLDGTSIESLFSQAIPVGISLDPPRGHVYWTSTDDIVRRSNLDGSGQTTVQFDGLLSSPIAIDTRPAVKVPAASAWGLVALSLAIASAGTVLLRRQRGRACHAR